MLHDAASRAPIVLVIDDNPGIRESLSLLLETHGYRVVTAADGKQGLMAFREHAPAVVVTDILMPEQDGIGAICELRRRDPAAKIVAISGSTFNEVDYLSVAKKLGADAAVEKTDLARLLEILPTLVSH